MTLLDYLPPVFGGPEIAVIQGALDDQVKGLWQARDGLMDQLNVDTATWGLAAWEEMLGLATEAAKSDDFRRSRIQSKLRGQGTTTVALVKNVAESFSNGQVDVVEHPEAYRFEVKFVGTIGIPPNMDDLTAAIEEIKPAHMDYDYIIIYRTWGQIAGMAWSAVGAHSWDAILGGELQ